MAENIKKIWANAQPISVYFQSLIVANPIDEMAIAEKYKSEPNSDEHDAPTFANLTQSLQSITVSAIISEHRKALRFRLIEYVRNKMVEGQLEAFGRTAVAGGLDTIVALADDHWIGAEINPEANTVLVGGQTIDLVRVLFKEKATIKKKGRRGPAPKSELRRSVITACLKDNANLLEEPPSTRVRTYKRYIEKHHKDEDLRRGFSPSAFQEDEQYLRENSKI